MSSLYLESFQGFVAREPALASLAALLVVAAVVYHLLQRPAKLNLPVVELIPGDVSYERAVAQGVAKYPNTPFILNQESPVVIIPRDCIDGIKSLPESQASMMQPVLEEFSSNVTKIGYEARDAVHAIKNDLTRHVASILDGLQDEARFAIDQEFGTGSDWTPIPVYMKITRVVALLSGRVFVGRPLSREEEWLNATISYTYNCTRARDALQKYPTFIRPVVGPWLPEVQDLFKQRKRGAELLTPILEEIRKREARGEKMDEYEDQQGTFCRWLMKYMGNEEVTAMKLAENQMGVSFAAIHTTSMALAHVIFDLASHPEYIKPLREEIQQVIAEDGQEADSTGFNKLKKASFTKLKKLDSFMKESQRLGPPGYSKCFFLLSPPPDKVSTDHRPKTTASMGRVVASPITLTSGHVLPKGTHFVIPSYAIATSEATPIFSSSMGQPPQEFDGFRFAKLRTAPGQEHKHQFASTSTESLTFGHGSHACPGRFFAGNEIKVIMVELLRNWDVRLAAADDGMRPANMITKLLCIPNVQAVVEFKRLKTDFDA
ncbi:hypothetical protein BP5796_03434 [Coleophoma crateriformis]|uniref:Uncharacterized protein n=1 Tax=Coleophoma crateriformis TaxID=565419 RepID=A0A3D8SN57_9HELO|nr:hypothetical protein BP5796_03434 [Coleophoma crateriformis]